MSFNLSEVSYSKQEFSKLEEAILIINEQQDYYHVDQYGSVGQVQMGSVISTLGLEPKDMESLFYKDKEFNSFEELSFDFREMDDANEFCHMVNWKSGGTDILTKATIGDFELDNTSKFNGFFRVRAFDKEQLRRFGEENYTSTLKQLFSKLPTKPFFIVIKDINSDKFAHIQQTSSFHILDFLTAFASDNLFTIIYEADAHLGRHMIGVDKADANFFNRRNMLSAVIVRTKDKGLVCLGTTSGNYKSMENQVRTLIECSEYNDYYLASNIDLDAKATGVNPSRVVLNALIDEIVDIAPRLKEYLNYISSSSPTGNIPRLSTDPLA